MQAACKKDRSAYTQFATLLYDIILSLIYNKNFENIVVYWLMHHTLDQEILGLESHWCLGVSLFKILNLTIVIVEPPHGKTNNLPRRKPRRRSASR